MTRGFQPNRRHIIASGAAAALSGVNWSRAYGAGVPHSEPIIALIGFVPSPDGSLIAFEYRDGAKYPNGVNRHLLGIGLLDWRTGKLTRIPNPAGSQLYQPSFSPDGKRLVVAQGVIGGLFPKQLAVIDLSTLDSSTITPVDLSPKLYPVFQAGSDKVLYVRYNGYLVHGLLLLDSTTQIETVILDERHGFVTELERASFVGADQIVFQGRGPVNHAQLEATQEIVSGTTARVCYQLRFGDLQASFLFPELEKVHKRRLDPGFASLSANADGSILSFTAQPIDDPKNDRREYNYEIFKVEKGEVSQLTRLRSYVAYPRMSPDGSIVAFGSDPKRIRDGTGLDLFVLDMRTKEITATGLRDRIVGNPEFALQ